MRTVLSGRVLRHDGVSILGPEQLADWLLHGRPLDKLRLTHLDRDAELFNENVSVPVQTDSDEPVTLSFRWCLPERYLNLNLMETVCLAFDARATELRLSYTAEQWEAAQDRVGVELAEIDRRDMTEFMRTIIYVLDTFREQGVVWGVGRGSSCASYVLFILGLHSVDPVLYDISHTEFFHD